MTGDLVFLKYGGYTRSSIHITRIQRETNKYMYVNNEKFKKSEDTDYIAYHTTGRFEPTKYVYSIDDAKMIKLHIDQCYAYMSYLLNNKINKLLPGEDFLFKYNLCKELEERRKTR